MNFKDYNFETNSIKDYIKKNIIYLDGSMGTLLQQKGLLNNNLPEELNLTHAADIKEIHKEYLAAGSNVISTNTFGANYLKYSKDKLEKIIEAAVNNAKNAVNEHLNTTPEQKCWVALDVGPSGKMLAPFGDFDFEEAVELYAYTIKLGVKYGVDLIFIETMSDCYETKAALLAAKESCDLPIFVSNSYDEDNKLLTGSSPAAMVAMLEGLGADAIGINCSLGPKALKNTVMEYLKYSSVPVILKPNAGLPTNINGNATYTLSAEDFANEMSQYITKGVRIVGGCCGTTPKYIEQLYNCSNKITPALIIPKNITCVSSYSHIIDFNNQPVLIGERINPTGKKLFKEALKNNDINYILNEGIAQEEKGAHILDVNVGLPEIDEKQMLKDVVCSLQSITTLPLQIDTASSEALESALRYYNGKAMINSVNGQKECMDKVFPLAKKYGGLIVALTLDECGIPSTAIERLEIARKILNEAKKYGINKKDIIFDPLTLTVATDNTAALVTLETVRYISTELHCHTILGISNVSFGLPNRDILNASFLTQALSCGLSAAIINPFSTEIEKTYRSYCALNNYDDNCCKYLDFCSDLEKVTDNVITNSISTQSNIANKIHMELNSATNPTSTLVENSFLKNSIIKGLGKRAAELVNELLITVEPLAIIENEIIPALDIVGQKYEAKELYLPQLLISAEAAKAAFDEIKKHMSSVNVATKDTIVLATVQGDIHDIGKNIVKLVLENYGYNVIDLGKDVSPKEILEATLKYNAQFVGLSALMTTTTLAMSDTIDLLKEKVPECKIIVGGAVLTEEYAAEIGADKYARDAMDAVRYLEGYTRDV